MRRPQPHPAACQTLEAFKVTSLSSPPNGDVTYTVVDRDDSGSQGSKVINVIDSQ